jgi:putative sigma-54 modulation protein
MQVIVKGRHINLSEALKAHAEEKLGMAAMRIFDRPAAKVEIELSDLGKIRDGVNMECRVTVFMPRGKPINVTETAEDMYKAIDLAHDRLIQQIKRARSKRVAITRDRKEAERQRALTARETLTTGTKPTDEILAREIAEYESSPL